MMRDDNAQMMVLESVIFAIIVTISLAFLIQISPTTIQGGVQTSDELKTLGDNALSIVYSETRHINDPGGNLRYTTNNPTSKLAVCIITNDYGSLIDSLNNILDNVPYNIYISNGTKTIFWCSSINDTVNSIPMMDPVALSHHPVSIDPEYLNGLNPNTYKDITVSRLYDDFIDVAPEEPYLGSTYEVILELS